MDAISTWLPYFYTGVELTFSILVWPVAALLVVVAAIALVTSTHNTFLSKSKPWEAKEIVEDYAGKPLTRFVLILASLVAAFCLLPIGMMYSAEPGLSYYQTMQVTTPSSNPSEESTILPETLTPSATDLPQVERDKLEIMELIDKFLNDLNQERLPDNWSDNLSAEYVRAYLLVYGSTDALSRHFNGSDRHVYQFTEFEWENAGTTAKVSVVIRYGYDVDFTEEVFWFQVAFNNNVNHWVITSDLFTSTPSTPTPTSQIINPSLWA